MEYQIKRNEEHNGNEVYFSSVPSREILDAMKAAGMRWHRAKKCWYGRNTEDEIFAIVGNHGEEKETSVNSPIKFDAVAVADSLTAAHPDNYGLPDHWRATWKAAGVKGVTVRSRRGGYSYSFAFTFRMLPGDILPFEECREGLAEQARERLHRGVWDDDKGGWIDYYGMTGEEQRAEEIRQARVYWEKVNAEGVSCSICHWWGLTRENSPEFSGQFWDRWEVVGRSVSCHNYDNSDPMTDYFEVGFYEDWEIKPVKEGAKADAETVERMHAVAEVFRTRDAEAKKAEEAERKAETDKRANEEERINNEGTATVVYTLSEFPHVPGTPYVTVKWSEFMPLHRLSEECASENGAESMAEKISLEAFENITETFCAVFKDRPGYKKTKFTIHDVNGEEVYTDRIDLGDGEKSVKNMLKLEIAYCEKNVVDGVMLNGGSYGKLEDIRRAISMFSDIPDMGALMEEAAAV